MIKREELVTVRKVITYDGTVHTVVLGNIHVDVELSVSNPEDYACRQVDGRLEKRLFRVTIEEVPWEAAK